VVPWAHAAGFRSTTTDGKFIGPFNAALRSPTVAGAFLQLQASEERHTSLSEPVRQVVILAVGAVWAADYEIYAHSAVARQRGIPADAVRILAAGTLPDTLGDTRKSPTASPGNFRRHIASMMPPLPRPEKRSGTAESST
jgi:4-carboxymuconolactone decarboxylase